MVSYGMVTDESVERDFFQRVQEHLITPDRRPMPPLELFKRRGVFIAAVSATMDNRLVGLYALTDHEGKAHIDVGYVLSKYRRHGIGFELLDRSLRFLCDCGRKPVYLDIRTAEMVRLVLRLRERVPQDTLLASISLDPAAKDLQDDLYL
jgi:ribosomal protein S18 acetylase RimI-like enzyme